MESSSDTGSGPSSRRMLLFVAHPVMPTQKIPKENNNVIFLKYFVKCMAVVTEVFSGTSFNFKVAELEIQPLSLEYLNNIKFLHIVTYTNKLIESNELT